MKGKKGKESAGRVAVTKVLVRRSPNVRRNITKGEREALMGKNFRKGSLKCFQRGVELGPDLKTKKEGQERGMRPLEKGFS